MLFDECKGGTKVKVVRNWPEYTGGWINSWNMDMDNYIDDGTVYTILSKSHAGIHFKENERFAWPWQSLEYANTIDLFLDRYKDSAVKLIKN